MTFQRRTRPRSTVTYTTSWLAMIIALLTLYILSHLALDGAAAVISLIDSMVSLFPYPLRP